MLLKDKVILITGASRGIGRAVAKRAAAEGAQTVLLAKSVERLEAVDDTIRARGGLPPVLVPQDLNDVEKLDALGPGLLERFGHLDGLVGNAAILGDLGPLTHLEPKTWQKVMTINLTANWRLLRICDPLLQRSEAGRAVFVTSGVTQGRFPYWGPYAISKAGLEAMVTTYAAEVSQSNVKANLIDPGVVRTGMRAEAMPGENPMTLPEPESITDRFVELLLPGCTISGQRVKV